MKKNSKPLSKGIKALIVILIIVMLGVVGFCTYKVLSIRASYKAAEDVYTELDNIIEVPEEISLDDLAEELGITKEELEEDLDDGDWEEIGINDDGTVNLLNREYAWKFIFRKLKKTYPDIVGYIKQDGVLSYPLMQAEDNDKYLRHMINGEYNVAGTLFVDYTFPECLDGPYAIIYGHDMNDNSMFGSFRNYDKEEYYKEHPEFDIYIGEKHYKYYVFSSFLADAYGEVYNYRYNANSYIADYEFLDFAKRMREACPYPTDAPEITKDSHIICLSTCVPWKDYSIRRVVFLVRGEEVKSVSQKK